MTREEAINIIRDTYHTETELEALKVLLPELQESEDERIRKFLLRLANRCDENSINFLGDIKKKDVIAYLEKQKEQKPTDEQFPPLEGLDAIKAKYYDNGFKNGFDEGVESVKPAEWSEEDKNKLNHILEIVHIASGREVGIDEKEELESFLKSLRPQPKKELSIEKAIKWLDDTFYFLDNSSGRGRDCEITTHDFDSLEEMYDSFRKAVIVDSELH